jgi:hypothetical protein
MPTILGEEDYDFCLDESIKPEDYFDQNIFTGYSDDDIQAWQITEQLNYKQNDEALIRPMGLKVCLGNSLRNNLFGK